MVQGGFPGSALITQLFRQLTKPLSRRIVKYAAKHPIFRRYFLLAPGRLYYKLETNLQRLKSPTVTKPKTEQKEKKVVPLKEETAIVLGSQLMIEVVIFGLLTVLMICDWLRSQRKSAKEEKQLQLEFEDLEKRKAIARERLEVAVRETDIAKAKLKLLQSELLEKE